MLFKNTVIIRLLVHQRRGAGIARRIEIGQALGGPPARKQDIDDHVAAFMAGALELQAERLAYRAASAIAGQ